MAKLQSPQGRKGRPNLPGWIPQDGRAIVKSLANELRSDAVKSQMLQRIATDARMKSVWGELLRMNKGQFFYMRSAAAQHVITDGRRIWMGLQKRARASNNREAEEASKALLQIWQLPSWHRDMQLAAISHLLKMAIYFRLNFSAIPDHEAKRMRAFSVALAQHLREAVEPLETLRVDSKLVAAVSAAADAAERSGRRLVTDLSPLFVKRVRGDIELRVFIRRLAAETDRLFGDNLYGTVATVANVLFDWSNLSGPSVRTALRERDLGLKKR